MDTDRRVALVPGARRGLGGAAARALVDDGFDLAACDISDRALQEACDELLSLKRWTTTVDSTALGMITIAPEDHRESINAWVQRRQPNSTGR